jgi:hypothetical protein
LIYPVSIDGPKVLFWVRGRDVETGLFTLPERPPTSALVDVRPGLELMTRDLQRLKDAGFFAEQTPYGADFHARRAADYFDRHYGESYLELSAAGVIARLADVIADLKVDICRVDKPVTAEDWGQHLKDLGKRLLQSWLAIMAEETPVFLRLIVNRTEFQRRHLAHLTKSVATKIDSLAPQVPSPVAPSAPDREPGSGPASIAAQAELMPPNPEPGADVALEIAPSVNMPVAVRPQPARTKRSSRALRSLPVNAQQIRKLRGEESQESFAEKCRVSVPPSSAAKMARTGSAKPSPK